MNISIEKLIELIFKELVAELSKRGINIDAKNPNHNFIKTTENNFDNIIKFDFNGFKTPLIREEKIINLNENVKEIIVPAKTIFTPSAMDLIKKKNIRINKNSY
jgi:hypothetical protein